MKHQIAVLYIENMAEFEARYSIKGEVLIKVTKGNLLIKMAKDAECYRIKEKKSTNSK